MSQSVGDLWTHDSSGESKDGSRHRSVTPPPHDSPTNEERNMPTRSTSAASLEGELFLSTASARGHDLSTHDDSESPKSSLGPAPRSPPPLGSPDHSSDVFVEDTHSLESAGAANVAPPARTGRPPLVRRVRTAGPQAPTASHRRTTSEGGPSSNTKPSSSAHHRVASAGDQSVLSALTDTNEYIAGGGGVGGGGGAGGGGGVGGGGGGERPRAKTFDAQYLLQPILSPNPKHAPTKKAHRRNVTIADIKTVNPLETEAERAIMRAVEKEHSGNNLAVPLFPNVPDEAIDMFQAPSKLSIRTTSKHDSSTSNSPSPAPDSPSRSGSAPRRRLSSTATSKRFRSQRFLDTSERGGVQKAKPVLPAHSVPVHEKLYELAEQMLQVQEDAADKEEAKNDEDGGDEKKQQYVRTPHHAAFDEKAPPATQTDNLVQNANALFRRSSLKKTYRGGDDFDFESIHDDDAPQEKERYWFFFKRSKNPKKTDAQSEDDVELGHGTGSDEGGNGDSGDPNRNSNQDSKKVPSPITKAGKTVAKKAARKAMEAKNAAVGDLLYFFDFLKPRKLSMFSYCKNVLQWLFVPTLILSFILYHAADNPKTCQDGCPSFSWLFLFLFIRQIITLSLAKVLEIFIIDYLSLRNRMTVRIFGPTLTLLVVQSKGWPFILLMWAVMDFAMLYGKGRFANHWMFYQDVIEVFSEENPSGNTLTNQWYTSVLIGAVIVSCAYAVKHLWMGVYLGKRTYRQYGKQLASVMNDMLLISLLSSLAHDLESDDNDVKYAGSRPEAIFKWNEMNSEIAEEESMQFSPDASPQQKTSSRNSLRPRHPSDEGSIPRMRGLSHDTQNPPVSAKLNLPQIQKSLNMSQKIRVDELMGAWNEPPRQSTDELREISLGAILQFRQALSYMDDDYPFSVLFGPARTRELCIQSSQELYQRLLLNTPEEPDLPFDTIALITANQDGEINPIRLKRLHKLFRPDAEGFLSMLDFLRSIDKVYKELRLLRAAIANSSQIDQAFERIFNAGFFVVLAFIVLPIVGLDPLALILSLSGLIVGFAFMIGPASSKFFEGILFILVRRPFDIGDRVHISSPSNDTNRDGSPGWFVEKVDLFTTTVRYATTNEVATYSNGSLAAERIINGARSPQAIVYINLKFGIDVEFSKVQIFRTTVESFVKARTREWLSLMAFRATRVEADLGFIEYVLVLQHVASWQDVGTILKSKAELASYCLEASKQLEMRYTAPPLPVNLALSKPQVVKQVEDVLEPEADSTQFGTVPLGAHDD